MALVDQLRHQQMAVEKDLSLPQRRAEVAARIREYYQNNGIQFTEAQIDQGVREFFSKRLVFEAPELSALDRFWSKVLLRRHRGILVIQLIAVTLLVVQCSRVMVARHEIQEAQRAAIAVETNAAQKQSDIAHLKARLSAVQQDPAYIEGGDLFSALPRLNTKAERALAMVDTSGVDYASEQIGVLEAFLAKVKAVQPMTDQLNELTRKVADIHLPAADSKATRGMQAELVMIKDLIGKFEIEKAGGQLRALRANTELIPKEVTIRVVDRPGTPSGVERCYDKALCNSNPGSTQGKSWYLVVEAVDLSDRPVLLPTVSSETGTGAWASQFAVRVPQAEYLKVKADKLDDGHLTNRVVGRKPAANGPPTRSKRYWSGEDMTPDTLIGITERNSRNAELRIRTAEQHLSELLGEQLALEQDITQRLGKIAALHLDQGNTQNEQVEQLDLAQAAHREHVSGYEDLRQECALKRPTFDTNLVYVYLRGHAFGTDQYRRNRLNRWMDNWLATKVNYLANRKNELSLIALGERNEALQAERIALISTLSASVDAQLAQARDQLGQAAIQPELDTLQRVVDNAKRQANAIQEKLGSYSRNEDPQYQRARQLLTDQLKTRSIGELIDLASHTPDDADDLIVEQLQTLNLRLKAVVQQLADTQEEAVVHQNSYQRAKDLERKVRNDAFTGRDVYFDLSTDFERLVESYMTQGATLGQVVDVLGRGLKIVRRSQVAAGATRGYVSASISPVVLGVATVESSNNNTASFSTSGITGGGSFRTTDSF
eukprot:gene17506-20949_t